MAFRRVMKFIRGHDETVVYIDGKVVRCAHGRHKLVPTILKNKGDKYMLVGCYTNSVDELDVAQDLEVCGVRE